MLSQYATPGAITHSSRNGNAEGNASRWVIETISATTAGDDRAGHHVGDESKQRPAADDAGRSRRGGRGRFPFAAAGACVIVRRTSVNTIACAVSQAW